MVCGAEGQAPVLDANASYTQSRGVVGNAPEDTEADRPAYRKLSSAGNANNDRPNHQMQPSQLTVQLICDVRLHVDCCSVGIDDLGCASRKLSLKEISKRIQLFKYYLTTVVDGKSYEIKYYSLNAILATG